VHLADSSRSTLVRRTVLDLNLLQWLSTTQTEYPQLYTQMMNGNASFQGLDITMLTARMGYEREMACLMDTVTVGFISAKTIGCIASDIVLYTSLIFIIGIVAIKFAMAVTFGWFLSWRLGSFKGETYAQRMARAEAIENWTDDIYRSAPSRYRPNVPAGGKGGKNRGAVFLPTTSRFSKADSMMVTSSRPSTTYGGGGFGRSQTTSTFGGKGLLSASPLGAAYGNTPPGSPMVHSSQSSNSLPWGQDDSTNDHSYSDPSLSACPFPLNNVIPQPPPDYEPFNFPLMHNILLVTAYSESIEGLRTTIDSLATTDYPNSHKVILVIADGMVRGSGSKLRTPDIVLGMMKEFVIPPEEVEAHSYVAIADGHKKHNMAKVYAGFYEYDDDTVEVSK
jgi:chitin synthase